ncbi:MAG: energy transducer TonB [Gammaproteobacteria bacterium]|nr:MAG: energy transducer TonB [Gammaproteobacteria bacterium]
MRTHGVWLVAAALSLSLHAAVLMVWPAPERQLGENGASALSVQWQPVQSSGTTQDTTPQPDTRNEQDGSESVAEPVAEPVVIEQPKDIPADNHEKVLTAPDGERAAQVSSHPDVNRQVPDTGVEAEHENRNAQKAQPENAIQPDAQESPLAAPGQAASTPRQAKVSSRPSAPVSAATPEQERSPEVSSTPDPKPLNLSLPTTFGQETHAVPTAPRYRLGQGQTPHPPYPYLARRMGWQGRVVIRLIVAADGRPLQAEVAESSGYPVLDNAALETLRRWRLAPSSVDQEQLEIAIEFRLNP